MLQLLSSYLAEVVKEILRVVEDTVTEYREEAARTRRENQTLRSQLRDVLLLEARAEWPRAGPIPSFSLEQLSLSEKSTSAVTPPTRRPVPAPQEPVVCPEQQQEKEVEQVEQVSSPGRVEKKPLVPTDVHKNQLKRSTEGPRTAGFSPALARVKEEPEERALTESEAEERGDHRGYEREEDRPDGDEDGAKWRGEDGAEWREEDGAEWMELELEEPGPEPPSGPSTDCPPPAVTQVLSQQPPHSAPRCPRCSETFPSPAALLHHLHQQKKTHHCDFCCKSFSQSADLRRHHRTHTGERPHRCSFCSRAFSQRGNLRRHLRIHTGERPYACPHCHRRFSDGDTLKKHQRTHSQARTAARLHQDLERSVPGLFLNHI